MRLDGTVVVVTGIGSGIGYAMAAAFVDEGAHVVGCDLDEARLHEAVDVIGQGPGEVTGVVADVTDRQDVQRVVETARETGPVDVLVNNVGIRQWHVTGTVDHHDVATMPPDVWETVVDTNLRGTFLCSRAVLPEMLDRDQGRLIHLSSGQGLSGVAEKSPYVATKFGVEGFHETLAAELAGTGVDSVAFRPPGGVQTAVKDDVGKTSEFDDPGVVAEPAVRIAAGAGENGGRYIATPDGSDLEPYGR